MTLLLERLAEGKAIARDESRELMVSIVKGELNSHQTAAVLGMLRVRGVTVDELEGFQHALLEMARKVSFVEPCIVDVCGTGGDRKNSFNISTTVAFVLAAIGIKVAKHGNYAVSSACGSSNVLEALGVTFSDDSSTLAAHLRDRNVCFLHAPLFHPALKAVKELRKDLGIRTVFNMLGPLVNPARPHFQITGVYDLRALRLYGALFQRQQRRFAVVHTLDGYDEVSLSAPVRVISHRGAFELSAADFGLEATKEHELLGGKGPHEAAKIVRAVLSGQGTDAQERVVAANAGLALWMIDESRSLREGVEKARAVIRSGAAAKSVTG